MPQMQQVLWLQKNILESTADKRNTLSHHWWKSCTRSTTKLCL